MNYPIWEIPAPGLLIALVAVIHVFISHFAVGGGLFLVLAERRARRENDPAFLDYVKRLSRFFVLVTLVLGASTGVGIWFTIGLVNPQATSSLINIFIWGWAIEWTLFVTEVAAALVYFYGWDRMPARTHMIIGWIYFWTAWMSLVVINGIITFMLTPGAWVTTRNFWDGLFNPTYFPSLFARTFVAIGLAGLYALFVAAGSRDRQLKKKVGRYAGRWILAMAVAGPISLLWYLQSAAAAGIPVGSSLGSRGQGYAAALKAALTLDETSGYPTAQLGFFLSVATSLLILFLTLVLLLVRREKFGRLLTGSLLFLGLLAMAGGEWIREDLRKPFVLGRYMFVNGVRLPPPEGIPGPPPGVEIPKDRFTVDALNRTGVLAASRWYESPLYRLDRPDDEDPELWNIDRQAIVGQAVFKQLCSICHSVDGYNGIRLFVKDQKLGGLELILKRLARVVDRDGETVPWSEWHAPGNRIKTWRSRRMPPFVGTPEERRALAVYLARLAGSTREEIAAGARGVALGTQTFEDHCSPCHAADSEWPIEELPGRRDSGEFYDLLGRLEEVNEEMPPFEGTEEERRALAEHLAGLHP
ncbi:MAG: cytochrome ubiquinol oxidase subunit I [Acidobacteriota bacterium]